MPQGINETSSTVANTPGIGEGAQISWPNKDRTSIRESVGSLG